MKICMFARSLPCHAIGGMELHIETLTKKLSEKGIDITLITTSHREGIEHEKKGNVDIYYLKDTKSGKYSGRWWKESIKKYEELDRIKKFDIVHSQSAGAYYLLKKKINKKHNTPSIVSLHGTVIDEIKTKLRLGLFDVRSKLGLIRNIYHYFMWDRAYVKEADAVIATSEKQYKVISKYYPLEQNKISIVYNGIDVGLFKPNVKVPDKGRKVVLSVARLKKEKGIQNVITAMKTVAKVHPDAVLKIIGGGEYRNNLEKLSMSLGLNKNVIFLGSRPYTELVEHINNADMFVNSTIRENGYDLTIIQAMSCEKVVIASKIGSVLNVIKHNENGIMYEKDDINSLSASIIDVFDMVLKYENIKVNARKTVIEKYSLEKMAEDTIKVYRGLLEGK